MRFTFEWTSVIILVFSNICRVLSMCSPYSLRTISVSFFILLLMTYTSAMAAEFNYGQGKMILQGGFLGLQDSVKEDITTYSLKAQHNNLFGSKVFYN